MKEKWILDFPLWLSLTSSEFKKHPEASLAQPQPRIPEDQSRDPKASRPKNTKPLSLDTDWTELTSSSGKEASMALTRLVLTSFIWGGGDSADLAYRSLGVLALYLKLFAWCDSKNLEREIARASALAC